MARAEHLQFVFMGLALAWQRQVGFPDITEDHDFFRRIDAEFSHLVDQIFTPKYPDA